ASSYHYPADHLYLHSFPTRRSSDLNAIEIPVAPYIVKSCFIKNITATIPIITECPAVKFANKRIINENGLVIIPIISIGAKIIFIGTGTPGIQKICVQ